MSRVMGGVAGGRRRRHGGSNRLLLWICLWLCGLSKQLQTEAQLIESERVAEYHKRGHVWPPLPEDYVPATDGWRELHARRWKQLQRIPSDGHRYNGYMSVVHSGLLAPNFTEFGFALTKAPQHLVDQLRTSLHMGLASGELQEEGSVDSIDSPNGPPLFLNQGPLNRQVLEELLPIHEAWSGKTLRGNNAYGLRIYRNESTLNMHVDKSESHIISSILHVDHDPTSEPWPLVIEDFSGKTHEVSLESGDMLLYESSKCMHGRPRPFIGAWYTSLFIHYFPLDWPQEEIKMNAHYRIPPTWTDVEPPLQDLPEMQVVDTSFTEPNCPLQWCGLKQSLVWNRQEVPPLQVGQFLSADGVVRDWPHVREMYSEKGEQDGELANKQEEKEDDEVEDEL